MDEEEQAPGEKPYEPTPKRLEEARRKGEVPHSADLTTAGAYGGAILVFLGLGGVLLVDLGAALAALLSQSESLSHAWFEGPVGQAALPAFLAILTPFAPVFVVPLAAALLVIIAQNAFVVSGEKLQPKLSRISPIAGLKNKFGRNGLFEFAKSAAKLLIVSITVGLTILYRLPEMLAAMALAPRQIPAFTFALSLEFLVVVFVLTLSLGVIDFLWQRAEHLRKHRMSHKELADETKQSEGDPQLKSRRRQKAMDIATNRMMADVPTADVVIVNPTHYAVALKWDRSGRAAPVCVAKGKDEVAVQIRKTAAGAGVPIRHDPPTARALFAAVRIGAEIAQEHYRAVALAIRFADAVRVRARGGLR